MRNKYLITGGAGFIGSNYVSRLLQRGEDVTIFDNLSRIGGRNNLEWLSETFGSNSFKFIKGDIRNEKEINTCAKDVDVIVHLAAQVAVTNSVNDPVEDFEINARGTFNVLEAARNSNNLPIVLYASTNKVYGSLKHLKIVEEPSRYRYKDYTQGISEEFSLDFHSPYGCSKGCGDQYAHDYGRIYNLPTIVLRQSCIYGPKQFGIEDQGWVAWFIIASILKKKITIYGNGKQVRDILYIDDLLDLYDLVIKNIDVSAGNIFNVGGGIENTISIWSEFGPILEKFHKEKIPFTNEDWRPGDQKVFVTDIRKAQQVLNWSPKIGVQEGIGLLFDWVNKNNRMFV